jgi:hypothetical protein
MAGKMYVDNNGYKRFSDSGKLVHRSVADMKIGRPLNNGEVVHHKDRNKQNNSFNNLQVFNNQAQHWGVHKHDAKNHGWKYSLAGNKSRKKK